MVCLKKFAEVHFGQLRGRGHSMVLLGADICLGLEVRLDLRPKPALDFTNTRSRWCFRSISDNCAVEDTRWSCWVPIFAWGWKFDSIYVLNLRLTLQTLGHAGSPNMPPC